MKQPTSSQSDYEANTTLTETENEPLHFTDWLGCGSVFTPVLCFGISPAQTRAHYTYTRTSILIRAQSLRDSHMHKLSNNLAFVTCMSKWKRLYLTPYQFQGALLRDIATQSVLTTAHGACQVMQRHCDDVRAIPGRTGTFHVSGTLVKPGGGFSPGRVPAYEDALQ